jgi:hypothetical protein
MITCKSSVSGNYNFSEGSNGPSLSPRARRASALLPGGSPRYVRCYDNGGATADRYTAVFTGRYRKQPDDEFVYLAMDARPFHPQGFGQHGSAKQQIDTNCHGFAPGVGRKNHLGTRIAFDQLPADCRKLVLGDYVELWGLAESARDAA